MNAFFYRLSGWTIGTDRALPFLVPVPPTPGPDIRIDFGGFDPSGPPGRIVGPFEIHGRNLVDLRPMPGIAIRIRDGRHMTVSAGDTASDAHLHTLLFGPATAILAQQRGQPALHASAVAFGETAIALAGHGGAGKSTTSQALLRRDGRLLTDDQLIVDPGVLLAYPSFPHAKLWSGSGAVLGIDVAGPPVAPGVDKFQMSTADRFRAEPCRLGAIVILVPGDGAVEPGGERLPVSRACPVLHRLVHYGEVGRAMGCDGTNLAWASGVARRVPVHLVRRSSDPARLESLLASIAAIAERAAGA